MKDLYRKIDWPDYEKIQEKLVPLVLKFLEQNNRTSFMNLFSVKEYSILEKEVPELFQSFSTIIQGDIDYLRIIYIDENFPSSSVAHTDFIPQDFNDGIVPERFYRLNWPILNSQSYETLFFRSDIPPTWRKSEDGKMSGYTWLDSEVELIDSVVTDRPTLIDVRQIHGFRKVAEALPRILLTFRPSNGDSDYLRQLVTKD